MLQPAPHLSEHNTPSPERDPLDTPNPPELVSIPRFSGPNAVLANSLIAAAERVARGDVGGGVTLATEIAAAGAKQLRRVNMIPDFLETVRLGRVVGVATSEILQNLMDAVRWDRVEPAALDRVLTVILSAQTLAEIDDIHEDVLEELALLRALPGARRERAA